VGDSDWLLKLGAARAHIEDRLPPIFQKACSWIKQGRTHFIVDAILLQTDKVD